MQQENHRRTRIPSRSVEDMDAICCDCADGCRRHGVAGLCTPCCCRRSRVTHKPCPHSFVGCIAEMCRRAPRQRMSGCPPELADAGFTWPLAPELVCLQQSCAIASRCGGGRSGTDPGRRRRRSTLGGRNGPSAPDWCPVAPGSGCLEARAGQGHGERCPEQQFGGDATVRCHGVLPGEADRPISCPYTLSREGRRAPPQVSGVSARARKVQQDRSGGRAWRRIGTINASCVGATGVGAVRPPP